MKIIFTVPCILCFCAAIFFLFQKDFESFVVFCLLCSFYYSTYIQENLEEKIEELKKEINQLKNNKFKKD